MDETMQVTKKQALQIVSEYPYGAWTFKRTRRDASDGTVSGNSEWHETYKHNGRPIVLLCIECASRKCRAYDVRNS